MTEVVPSPTSSSCVLLNSIIDCNKGRKAGTCYKNCQKYAAAGAVACVKADLGCRVRDIYLPQNCITVICQHNTCKGKHMKRLYLPVMNAFGDFVFAYPQKNPIASLA